MNVIKNLYGAGRTIVNQNHNIGYELHEGMHKDDKKHGLCRIIKRDGTALIGIFDENNLIGG